MARGKDAPQVHDNEHGHEQKARPGHHEHENGAHAREDGRCLAPVQGLGKARARGAYVAQKFLFRMLLVLLDAENALPMVHEGSFLGLIRCTCPFVPSYCSAFWRRGTRNLSMTSFCSFVCTPTSVARSAVWWRSFFSRSSSSW